MSAILGGATDSVGALRGHSVKPLRATARAREGTTLNVADLKNGGTLNLGGLLEEGADALRNPAAGARPRASAAQSRNAGLSLPERLEKLVKIKKSATDYEAVFVDQLVKLMRPSPLTHTPGGETFSEIAEQPFRDFLSQAGGLGLAKSIVEQIARQEGLERTLQEHPEIMGPNWRPVIPGELGLKLPGALKMGRPAPTGGPEAEPPGYGSPEHGSPVSGSPEPGLPEPGLEANGSAEAGAEGAKAAEIAWLRRDFEARDEDF